MSDKQIFEIYSLTPIFSARTQIASFEHLYKNYEHFLNEYLEDEIQKEVDKINDIGVENFTNEQVKLRTNDLSQYYGLSFQAKEL